MCPMRNSYRKMKRELEALKEENSYLHDDIKHLSDFSGFVDRLRGEKQDEVNSLQQLILLNNQVQIMMTDMLNYCDQNTVVGTAFKLAILQYQKVLADRMSCLQDNNNAETD